MFHDLRKIKIYLAKLPWKKENTTSNSVNHSKTRPWQHKRTVDHSLKRFFMLPTTFTPLIHFDQYFYHIIHLQTLPWNLLLIKIPTCNIIATCAYIDIFGLIKFYVSFWTWVPLKIISTLDLPQNYQTVLPVEVLCRMSLVGTTKNPCS